MIRNLNQVSFQGFGNVPPERTQSAKLFEKNAAVSLQLSQENTIIYSAKADTWVSFDSGISVLSLSQCASSPGCCLRSVPSWERPRLSCIPGKHRSRPV